MGDWPNWMGDLPTWLTTAAIGFAALSYVADRRRHRDEKEREAKAQARNLSAWAVTDVDAEPRVYGVILDNASGSTFHDVKVWATFHNKPARRQIELYTLPPGQHFVQFNGNDARYTWAFPIPISTYVGSPLVPYTKTEGYQVDRVEFTDNLDQHWAADKHAVLRKAFSVEDTL